MLILTIVVATALGWWAASKWTTRTLRKTFREEGVCLVCRWGFLDAAPEELETAVSAQHWYKIMEMSVDCFKVNRPPEILAQHLLTCMQFSGCLDALPELADSNPDKLKLKAALLQVSDPYAVAKIKEFVAFMDAEDATDWIDAFLGEFRRLNAFVVASSESLSADPKQPGAIPGQAQKEAPAKSTAVSR